MSKTTDEDLEAVIRSLLPEVAGRQPSEVTSEPPSEDELFDLAEGRLSATEREELIERLVEYPEARAMLADILAGLETQTMETPQQPARGGLLRQLRSMLSPSVLVPATVLSLFLVVVLPAALIKLQGGTSSTRSVEDPEEVFGEEGEESPSTAPGIPSATGEEPSRVPALPPVDSSPAVILETSSAVLLETASEMERHLTEIKQAGDSGAGFLSRWEGAESPGGKPIFPPRAGLQADWPTCYELIREVYLRVVESEPSAAGYLGLARAELALGRIPEARDHLALAVELDPQDAQAARLLEILSGGEGSSEEPDPQGDQ